MVVGVFWFVGGGALRGRQRSRVNVDLVVVTLRRE